jgi:hypothetical protein
VAGHLDEGRQLVGGEGDGVRHQQTTKDSILTCLYIVVCYIRLHAERRG